MVKIKRNIFLLFLVLSQTLISANVSVRIFTTKTIKSFIFSPLSGNYVLYGNGKMIADADASVIFQFTLKKDSILVKTFEKTIGSYSSLKIVARSPEAVFKMKSVAPESKVRTYDGDVDINIATDKQQFLLINKVDLEDYIAGVVESESGTKTTLEYYKLQTILCRTYLLAHYNRHAAEGFQVCDDVHCQAYLSRSKDDEIFQAVQDTKGMVIVDSDLNLITAAFHSNCGGETVNSEDVWSLPTTYLKSVIDTFCLKQPQTKWKKEIPLKDWKAYLQLKHQYLPADSLKLDKVTSFSQLNGRATCLIDDELKIPLKVIRSDFQLKSTYFSIEQQGDKIIFNGRGYGHGVGVCQEGAMHMADLRYTYKEILHFYYKDVHLVDLTALSYFRQE